MNIWCRGYISIVCSYIKPKPSGFVDVIATVVHVHDLYVSLFPAEQLAMSLYIYILANLDVLEW